MAKSRSKQLYELIRSMRMSEKRYFKIHAKADEKTDSRYLQLFDEMAALPEPYDEDALSRALYGEAYTQHANTFSALKGFLKEALLRVLQQYDERTNVYLQLSNKLQQLHVLHRRSQYDQSLTLLKKALKVAYQYEQFGKAIELLQWERQLYYQSMDVKKMSTRLSAINEAIVNQMEKLQNLEAYRHLFYDLWLSVKKDANLRKPEQVKKLRKYMQHPLMKDIRRAKSHRAKSYFLHIKNLHAYCVLDYEAFRDTGEEWLKLLESAPHFLDENVSEYIAALNNLTLSYGLLNQYDEVKTCLRKFKNIKPVTQDDALKIHRQYYSGTFALCIATGQFELGYDAMQQHSKELEKLSGMSEFEHSAFSSQYFYICFGSERYDEAMLYLNKWLSPGNGRKQRRDLQIVARFIMLILHYEMGNQLLLESLMRSSYRFFKRQKQNYQIEKVVLRFMRKSAKATSRKQMHRLFFELRQELVKLSDIPEEQVFFQHFNFIAWLDSKMQDISFAEAIHRQLQNNG